MLPDMNQEYATDAQRYTYGQSGDDVHGYNANMVPNRSGESSGGRGLLGDAVAWWNRTFSAKSVGSSRRMQRGFAMVPGRAVAKYVLDDVRQALHTSGRAADIAIGKSQFFHRLNADELTLTAARYADEHGLWNRQGSKAKVRFSEDIGVLSNVTPTNVMNLYGGIIRKGIRRVHGAPGTP